MQGAAAPAKVSFELFLDNNSVNGKMQINKDMAYTSGLQEISIFQGLTTDDLTLGRV